MIFGFIQKEASPASLLMKPLWVSRELTHCFTKSAQRRIALPIMVMLIIMIIIIIMALLWILMRFIYLSSLTSALFPFYSGFAVICSRFISLLLTLRFYLLPLCSCF